MLKVDSGARRLVPADNATLSTEEIRERADLQAFILASWDAFVDEIGMPDLMLIGSEIVPHGSCANRIDILAFDGDDGRPVIIELKRERHRLQLLQGLSYAGMLSTWTNEHYLQSIQVDENEDLRNSLQNRDANVSPAVILLAESYDPEVILTAQWLAAAHKVRISCFSMKVFRFASDLHLLIQRDFPLRGIEDTYVARRQPVASEDTEQTWADVKSWVNFDWGPDAIEELLATPANNSARRRYFATPFSGAWGGYMLYVQSNRIKVRFHSRREGDVEYWNGRLGFDAVSTWGSSDTAQGLSISLPTREAFDAFREGLQELPPTADGEPSEAD